MNNSALRHGYNSTEHARCRATEVRLVRKNRHTSIRSVEKTVRCSLHRDHDPEKEPHEWHGTEFGVSTPEAIKAKQSEVHLCGAPNRRRNAETPWCRQPVSKPGGFCYYHRRRR